MSSTYYIQKLGQRSICYAV